MPTDLNNQQPIDPNDPAIRAMFQNLQGNILKGHGRVRFRICSYSSMNGIEQKFQWP